MARMVATSAISEVGKMVKDITHKLREIPMIYR